MKQLIFSFDFVQYLVRICYFQCITGHVSLTIKSGENKSGRGRGGVSELTFWLNLCFFACPRVLDHFSSLFVIISHEQVKSHMNDKILHQYLQGFCLVYLKDERLTDLMLGHSTLLHSELENYELYIIVRDWTLWDFVREKKRDNGCCLSRCLCHVEFFLLFWPWLF